MNWRIPALAIVSALWLAVVVGAIAPPSVVQGAQGPSLYARMGSYDGIAGFVDTAFPRVAMHPELRPLFQGHSRDSQMRQRQLIVDALCQASGGPCIYIGRDMKAVHVGLGITPEQWTAFLGVISKALEERVADKKTRGDFLALFVTQFRPAVVE